MRQRTTTTDSNSGIYFDSLLRMAKKFQQTQAFAGLGLFNFVLMLFATILAMPVIIFLAMLSTITMWFFWLITATEIHVEYVGCKQMRWREKCCQNKGKH